MNSDNLYCRSDIVLSENERREKRWRERVFETPALTIFAFLDGSNDANFASFARRNGRWTVTRAVARTSFVYSRQAGELDQFRSTKGFPESADETPQLAGSGTTRIRYFLEAMFLRYSLSLSLIHRLRCIYIYIYIPICIFEVIFFAKHGFPRGGKPRWTIARNFLSRIANNRDSLYFFFPSSSFSN